MNQRCGLRHRPDRPDRPDRPGRPRPFALRSS